MMINTSLVIDTIKQDIQKKIDMEQKRLSDINESLVNAQQFLLENDYMEIKENDDILESVMKTIKKLQEQNKIDDDDISNINKSIQSLKTISSHIDDSIISSLETKIKEIKDNINKTGEKMSFINECLNILLNLRLVCPVCNGNGSVSSQDNEKRFNKTSGTGTSISTCAYCDGVGYLDIGKVLLNEKLMENEMYMEHKLPSNITKIHTLATENLQNLGNVNNNSLNNGSKNYIIERANMAK